MNIVGKVIVINILMSAPNAVNLNTCKITDFYVTSVSFSIIFITKFLGMPQIFEENFIYFYNNLII